ncbi:MerR family DNA-binding protein [Aureimonas psammosilenae]|uniref:MerR family DNA-binding protein n=1 Tax=Aureimonas psammosilenae TaxID=2495496 RepID=UPI0038B2B921
MRHARELGFEIEPIRQLLTLSGHPGSSCEGADEIARAHLADIDHKIARLTALRVEIARMADCTNSSVDTCRVIEVLGDHGRCVADHH